MSEIDKPKYLEASETPIRDEAAITELDKLNKLMKQKIDELEKAESAKMFAAGLAEGIRRARGAVVKVSAKSDFVRLAALNDALAAIDAVKGE